VSEAIQYSSRRGDSASKQPLTMEQIAYAFSCAGMTSTQAGNIYSRLHTFLTAVGAFRC
jgi:hypothetical protein